MGLRTLRPIAVLTALAACMDGSDVVDPVSVNPTIIEDPGAQVVIILCVTSWRDFRSLRDDGTIGAAIDFEVRDLTNGDEFIVDGTPTITAAPWSDIDSFEEARAVAAGRAPGCKLVWRRSGVSFDDESSFGFTGLSTPSRAWRKAIIVWDETNEFGDIDQDPPFPGGGAIGFTGPDYGVRVYFMYVTSVIRGAGYWANLQNADWTEAKVFPDDRLEFRFGPLPPGYNDWTFFQAMSQKGDGDGTGQLLRHAAAAYLNASHPHINYPWTQQQIVEAVHAAIEAGEEAIEDQKDEFEKMNSVDEDQDDERID